MKAVIITYGFSIGLAMLTLSEAQEWFREFPLWVQLGSAAFFFVASPVVAYRKEIAAKFRSSEWISGRPTVSRALKLLGNLGVLGFVVFLIPWAVAAFFGAVWASVFFFAWIVSGFDVSSAVVYANGWLAGYGDR